MNHDGAANGPDQALAHEIISLLRDLPGWSQSQISLLVLSGGITNRNFIAQIDGSRYVVRVPGERTEVLGINRTHEANATI